MRPGVGAHGIGSQPSTVSLRFGGCRTRQSPRLGARAPADLLPAPGCELCEVTNENKYPCERAEVE